MEKRQVTSPFAEMRGIRNLRNDLRNDLQFATQDLNVSHSERFLAPYGKKGGNFSGFWTGTLFATWERLWRN